MNERRFETSGRECIAGSRARARSDAEPAARIKPPAVELDPDIVALEVFAMHEPQNDLPPEAVVFLGKSGQRPAERRFPRECQRASLAVLAADEQWFACGR